MGWVSRHKRNGALLALAALALQLALSFGHMHRDDLGLPLLPTADQTLNAFAAVPSPAGTVPSPQRPTEQGHQPASDDYCAICASMALVATATPSLPPVLIVPTAIRHAWQVQTASSEVAARIALPFQARGPPGA
jgi:hypothetical protein